MKNNEKQNCYNCNCKSVCMKIADIDEQGLISWNEYVKNYGCKEYQPKLPEDNSVVLSREEYTEFKKYKTDWLNSEKMHLQAELEYTEFELDCASQSYSQLSKLYDETIEKLKKYEDFNNNLIVDNTTLKDKIELKSKETAKKFRKLLRSKLVYDDQQITIKDKYIVGETDIDEIAKQFGVEIKE